MEVDRGFSRRLATWPELNAPPRDRCASEEKECKQASFDSGADRNDPGIRHFLLRLLAVLGASLLVGVLLLTSERPDHLPANPIGNGKGIEVMQVIAQAKASRGADVAELTEAEINGYLRQFGQEMARLVPMQ